MGIPRPKRLLPGNKDRVRICRTRFKLHNGVDNGVDIAGNKTQCMLYVCLLTRDMRRNWKHLLHNIGLIVAEQCGDAFRVVGTVEQLESAVLYRCVRRYEYVLSARAPQGEKCDEAGIPYALQVSAQGGGPLKVRSSGKPAKKPPRWVSGENEVSNHTAAIADSHNTTNPFKSRS